MPNFRPPSETFKRKKAKILEGLSVSPDQYTDASPKGSVDVGIRDLIDELNAHEGLVTTSSCAGRVSVFLEGRKKEKSSKERDGKEEDDEGVRTAAAASSSGGKGGGGTWLFVSHDPLDVREDAGMAEEGRRWVEIFGMKEAGGGGGGGLDVASARLIHFKFEPMVSFFLALARVLYTVLNRLILLTNHTQILHVLTASHEHAQLVIQAGMEAGFRETGAVSILPAGGAGQEATPIVAVRSMGLSFESLLGIEGVDGKRSCIVSPEYVRMLVRIGNERFVENEKRISRFRTALQKAFTVSSQPNGPARRKTENGGVWEDPEARKQRKREEGLRMREEMLRLRQQQQQGADKELRGPSPDHGSITHVLDYYSNQA